MSEIYSQLGQVYLLLLENREITTKPLHRRLRPGEREAATLLKDIEFFQAMQEFVAVQGFSLKSYSDFDMPGIAPEEICFLLVRTTEGAPPYFGEDSMMAKMAIRQGESKESRAVWFLHLWALANHLLYTTIQRSVREVARYTDAAFSSRDLIEATKEHIEAIRQTGEPEDPAAQKVWSILVDPKHSLSRRVNAFLQVMVDGRFLYQPHGEEIYCQTLLGAIEMSELFERGIALLISEDQHKALFKEIVDLSASVEPEEVEGETNGSY